jgi:hypothetical protein
MEAPHPSSPGFWIFFVGTWLFVTGFLALGGWRGLARAYPAPSQAPDVRFSMRSGKLGIVNYGNCLNLGASKEGLHLSVFFLFRFGNPPVVVPWNDIQATAKKGWIFDSVVFRFAKAPGSTLRIGEDLGKAIINASNGALTLQSK